MKRGRPRKYKKGERVTMTFDVPKSVAKFLRSKSDADGIPINSIVVSILQDAYNTNLFNGGKP